MKRYMEGCHKEATLWGTSCVALHRVFCSHMHRKPSNGAPLRGLKKEMRSGGRLFGNAAARRHPGAKYCRGLPLDKETLISRHIFHRTSLAGRNKSAGWVKSLKTDAGYKKTLVGAKQISHSDHPCVHFQRVGLVLSGVQCCLQGSSPELTQPWFKNCQQKCTNAVGYSFLLLSIESNR